MKVDLGEFDKYWMRQALRLAEKAASCDEVPVGALILDPSGQLVSYGFNQRETTHSVLGHAELIAIHRAEKKMNSWRLPGCTMFVTLEPCVMCAGAIVQARLKRVVFGSTEPKAGAAVSVFELLSSPHLNHQCEVTQGILADECSDILSSYFRKKREVKREQKRNQRTGSSSS